MPPHVRQRLHLGYQVLGGLSAIAPQVSCCCLLQLVAPERFVTCMSPLTPDAKVRMYLVYPKYWSLKLMPLMVYPRVLLHPTFSIKATDRLEGLVLAISSAVIFL